jgi:hypothetical protein
LGSPYDREQAGVRQRGAPMGPWVIRSAAGTSKRSFESSHVFINALREEMTKAPDIEALFGVWEQNIAMKQRMQWANHKIAPLNFLLSSHLNRSPDMDQSSGLITLTGVALSRSARL